MSEEGYFTKCLKGVGNLRTERLVILCIGIDGEIHHTEIVQGTHMNVHCAPETVCFLAVKHESRSVIIAHSHATGIGQFSEEDDRWTKSVQLGLNAVGIKLLQHFLIFKKEKKIQTIKWIKDG